MSDKLSKYIDNKIDQIEITVIVWYKKTNSMSFSNDQKLLGLFLCPISFKLSIKYSFLFPNGSYFKLSLVPFTEFFRCFFMISFHAQKCWSICLNLNFDQILYTVKNLIKAVKKVHLGLRQQFANFSPQNVLLARSACNFLHLSTYFGLYQDDKRLSKRESILLMTNYQLAFKKHIKNIWILS